MPQTATVTLNTLRCGRNTIPTILSLSPYLWPPLVMVTETPLSVDVVAPPTAQDRVVIRKNLRAGQSAGIPPSVGELSFQFDATTKTHVILVIALFLKFGTPVNAVDAGFKAFVTHFGVLSPKIS